MTTSRKIVVRILLLVAGLVEQDQQARKDIAALWTHISYETSEFRAEAPHA